MLEPSAPVLLQGVALLLVRIILTITFFAEARIKLRDMKKFAKNDGVPVWLGYGIAFAELAAAVAMLTGILSWWAGVGLVLLMLITTSMHIFKWHSPYWASKGGWEYDVLLLTLAAVIVAFGPGQFTVVQLLQ